MFRFCHKFTLLFCKLISGQDILSKKAFNIYRMQEAHICSIHSIYIFCSFDICQTNISPNPFCILNWENPCIVYNESGLFSPDRIFSVIISWVVSITLVHYITVPVLKKIITK